MNITALMRGLRYQPRHRAADIIPIIEADRDKHAARADQLANRLHHADLFGRRMCAELEQTRRQLAEMTDRAHVLAAAHDLLLAEHDELAHRYTALAADLANLRAITSPAPADRGPAIPLRPWDPDKTEELNVSTLWDGINGIKVADVRSLIVRRTGVAA